MDRGGGYGGDQTKRAFRSEPYLMVWDYDITPEKFRCPRLNYPYYPSGAIQAVSRHFLLHKFDLPVADNFVILCSESFYRGSDPPTIICDLSSTESLTIDREIWFNQDLYQTNYTSDKLEQWTDINTTSFIINTTLYICRLNYSFSKNFLR